MKLYGVSSIQGNYVHLIPLSVSVSDSPLQNIFSETGKITDRQFCILIAKYPISQGKSQNFEKKNVISMLHIMKYTTIKEVYK